MEYLLSMTFLTTSGSKTTLTISDVSPTLTKAQIMSAMDTIIAKNVFEPAAGAYLTKYNASFTQKTVTTYEF